MSAPRDAALTPVGVVLVSELVVPEVDGVVVLTLEVDGVVPEADRVVAAVTPEVDVLQKDLGKLKNIKTQLQCSRRRRRRPAGRNCSDVELVRLSKYSVEVLGILN